MSSLVPTLRAVLQAADTTLEEGRLPAARRAYEDLLERAQVKHDRPMQVVARSMLARCLLRIRDLEGAHDQLELAVRDLDPAHLESVGRYRAARCRLVLEEGPPAAAQRCLREYLQWAEDHRRGEEILDAALMLGAGAEVEQRAEWIERGLLQAVELGVTAPLGRGWNALAGALDQLGRTEAALEAYQQSLRWHRQAGRGREAVAAAWAVGALLCRIEEWPLARTSLEEAITQGERLDDSADLVALAMADLAQVYEAAGDVVEARRVLLTALRRAREQELATLWPQRWEALRRQAERLELDPSA